MLLFFFHCYLIGELQLKKWSVFTVFLWYSCFDRSILMFLIREGLQCRFSTLKHCLMKLGNDINQFTFVFPFAETRSIDVSWPREYTLEQGTIVYILGFHLYLSSLFTIIMVAGYNEIKIKKKNLLFDIDPEIFWIWEISKRYFTIVH